jgi:hypothetical protein
MAAAIRMAGNKEGNATKRAMTAAATGLECNKKSNGFGGKSNGNEGSGQAMATRAMATVTARTWAMVIARMLADNKEDMGKGSKGNGDGNEGGGG